MTGYDWRKTLSKVVWISLEIIISGAFVYLTKNVLFMAMVPALEGIRNIFNHMYD